MANDDLLSTSQVARKVRRSVATVNRWAAKGELVPAMTFPGKKGARMYRAADVDAWIEAEEARWAEEDAAS